MKPARLSIVIPTLNEAGTLPALLDDLQSQQELDAEIIVADGGSDDATPQIAAAAGARVLQTARGRGRQMNAGAAAATGDWLLFLHADSRLPSAGLLAQALQHLGGEPGDRVAGHFRLRFRRQQPGHDFFFRYLESKTALGRPGTINGDQGLLIRRDYFDGLGGYDERLPFLEDQDLAERIFASGRWRLLPGCLETSARRFEQEGHAPRYALMALIMAMRAAGLDEFFRRAPQVYAAQGQSGPLRTRGYRQLAHELLGQLPRQQRLAAYRRIGALLGANTWQLAHALDTAAGGEGRWLRRYDALPQHRTTTAATARLGGALAALALWMPLPRGC